MAGEVGAALAARVRLRRRSGDAPGFLLDVSLEVPGGITILFGPSGAGKSTLLDCIAGLTRPDAGRIAIGNDVLVDIDRGVDLPPQQRHIAYVFQTLALFPHMSVQQNVGYGLARLERAQREAAVRQVMEAFHVDRLSERKPAEISGGEQQRVALARSLVTLPRVLLLDEPLTGLDAALKTSMVDDLRAWNAAHRIPVIYVTHSREEVDALGERVLAMDHGRIISAGTPGEVLDAPRRTRLAQAAGFENLLAAKVVALREKDGVMRVQLGGSSCEIEVPLASAAVGDSVQVAVRAGDILLASESPRGLSARNVLEGRVASIDRRGTLVAVRVDCGVSFLAHITPGAERALHLALGNPVWLVLKTHSCHLLAD